MAGNLSTYAGGGNRWITNPKHLNKQAIAQTRLSLKSAPGTLVDSSSASFFTALALRGAQTSITVADTYVTVANLSGSGFLFNCVSPQHSSTATPTIRITVDGTVYTITPSAAIGATTRLVLGPVVPTPSVAAAATGATAGDIIVPNAANDNGFVNALVGGVPTILSGGVVVGIPTPEAALSFGMQCLRFESSCLIEMKCSLLSGTAVDKQCGATYMMDL